MKKPHLLLLFIVAACIASPDTSRIVTNSIDLNYSFHPDVTMEYYFFRVDSYNESGFTSGAVQAFCP